MVSGILFMCLKYHHLWCPVGCLLNPMAFHYQDHVFTLVCLCFHMDIRGGGLRSREGILVLGGIPCLGMLVELIPAVLVRL